MSARPASHPRRDNTAVAPTKTTLATTVNHAIFGQSVTLTATLTSSAGRQLAPPLSPDRGRYAGFPRYNGAKGETMIAGTSISQRA
jgi:hypothetical protein